MNRKPELFWLLILCPFCALLDYFPFSGALRPITLIHFTYMVLAISVVYLEWEQTMIVALTCGVILDSGAAHPHFMLGFVLYAGAGRLLARSFYTPRSPFHILAQLLLFTVFHLAMDAATLFPLEGMAVRPELLIRCTWPDVALAAGALALWPAQARGFSVYRL